MILLISRFGFEGWIWVLIPAFPDPCILLTFDIINIRKIEFLSLKAQQESREKSLLYTYSGIYNSANVTMYCLSAFPYHVIIFLVLQYTRLVAGMQNNRF